MGRSYGAGGYCRAAGGEQGREVSSNTGRSRDAGRAHGAATQAGRAASALSWAVEKHCQQLNKVGRRKERRSGKLRWPFCTKTNIEVVLEQYISAVISFNYLL